MKFKNHSFVLLGVFLVSFCLGCNFSPSTKQESFATVASIDGSPIAYDTYGNGEFTIVFVHCWTCSHKFWDTQIAYFSRHYRVVWVDLAGHGESGTRRQKYTMQSFGHDVAAVVNKIDATNVVLVGHSMGGPVIVEAAKLLGDRVVGIVGVDTFYTPFVYPKKPGEISAFVAPFEKDFAGTSEQMVRSMLTQNADPAMVDSIVQVMTHADQEMAVSAMYEIFYRNARNAPKDLPKFSNKLRNINAAPTGKEQPLHNSVVLVPGAGHFVAQEQPKAFNKALEAIIVEFGEQGRRI